MCRISSSYAIFSKKLLDMTHPIDHVFLVYLGNTSNIYLVVTRPLGYAKPSNNLLWGKLASLLT